MKIKRIQIKAYYSYCNNCNKSIDSDEKFLYDGYCRYCYYNRYQEGYIMNICNICNKKFTKNGVANNEITICNKCMERILKETIEEFLKDKRKEQIL